ncbi:hypothetical protein NEUTE1DRAFT_115097 [Neurospora tetrasperma FGSC 2508]|uniref:Uncharacterized protein n=1 Tax=Neurospora tetrasperma (strain FGSC 2508 / ATCC MYA-4615 / P0657) TaxID=510951 RepID=F8N285_NEUT8|nr:uncharacterized protein NEUTE1DRAFT_115097 [Neurospora tetrasperma FGSC 2508]EGO53256.1 hypothetical protein NEUTE1DRAFT_115097 [Neurospora tetrasperma FGSC 2508]
MIPGQDVSLSTHLPDLYETPQPAGGGGPGHGGDSRARSFPADEYLGYSSDDDDDGGDFYRRSSGRAPGRAPSGGSSRGYNYDGYDDGYEGDSDRGYSQGGDDRHHGHGGPSSSSTHRDEQRYYAPGGSSSSGRHRPHDRDYGHDSGPSPPSRHRDDDMRRGDPRAPMERGISGHESRREIPFRYVSPFDLGFAGGSRERGGGSGRSHQDSFGEDWNIPSHSRHGRSSGRDDGWFSDGESDWSGGFW